MWKVIPGTDGRYEASIHGEIRNSQTKKIRKPQVGNDGKHIINLPKPSPTKYVHRLVALTFIQNPSCLPQVDHRNGDKSDNSTSNLRWCTNADNQAYRSEQGNDGSSAISTAIYYGDDLFPSIHNLARYIANTRGSKIETVRKELKSAKYGEKIMYGKVVRLRYPTRN